jgi:acetyl-CoA acetyltransferase
LPSDKEESVVIKGWGQTKYIRKPSENESLFDLFAKAISIALDDANLKLSDIDGFAVSSFTLKPDRAIDLAVKFNLKVNWIMDGSTGGASGIDILQHAASAIKDKTAKNILLLSGDLFREGQFADLVLNYNTTTRDYLAPSGIIGPNPLFALLTTLQMDKYHLTKKDYGSIVIAQRKFANSNPKALYRELLTMSDYLAAPMISTPLGLYDCVPVVSGASAIVVGSATGDKNAKNNLQVKKIRANHNYDFHNGDGTSTGLSEIALDFWNEVNLKPEEVSYLALYDDYPAIVLAQLMDLGFVSRENSSSSLQSFLDKSETQLNSSGGQLTCGQNGAGGGMHGLIEVCEGLKNNPNSRYGVA